MNGQTTDHGKLSLKTRLKVPYITEHSFQVIHEGILVLLAFCQLGSRERKRILSFSKSFHQLVPFIEHVDHKLFEVRLLVLPIMDLWWVLRDRRHDIAHHFGDRTKR